MSADTIQRARDVLAKWRENATSGPWSEVLTEYGDGITSARTGYMVASYVDAGDAALIVGTAGNPDLLDAIDGLLAAPYQGCDAGGAYVHQGIARLAAAIIAADERMSA